MWVYLGEIEEKEAVREAESTEVARTERKVWEIRAVSRRSHRGCGSLCPTVC